MQVTSNRGSVPSNFVSLDNKRKLYKGACELKKIDSLFKPVITDDTNNNQKLICLQERDIEESENDSFSLKKSFVEQNE